MKPDLIMQYCVYCDYPLWRAVLKRHRNFFGKVILYPSKQHGTVDLEEFAKRVIPETWVERPFIDYGKQDWRQAETEPCVALSTSDWVFFMEQDFFVADWSKFFVIMTEAMKRYDMIGCWSPSQFPYFHPCCILMKRELLDKTNKDYSAHPEVLGSDHFAMLTRDAERLGAKTATLEDLGFKEWTDYFHLGGLTYTFQDWKNNGKDIFGMKSLPAYQMYMYWARRAPVEQSPEYLAQSTEIEAELLRRLPGFTGEDNEWTKFFKHQST